MRLHSYSIGLGHQESQKGAKLKARHSKEDKTILFAAFTFAHKLYLLLSISPLHRVTFLPRTQKQPTRDA